MNETVTPGNHSMSRRIRGWSSHQGNKYPSGGYDWKKHFRRQNSWLERMRNSLMVVATLTATMAFQAGMNPPGGVWQDFSGDNSTSLPVNNPISLFGIEITQNMNVSHTAGISIMADTFYGVYFTFLSCNTIGFIASLSTILLLISGLPMRRRLFVWVLMVIMWIVITSMAYTYAISVIYLTPRDQRLSYEVIFLCIIAWTGLMALLVVLHTIRLILRAFRACWRTVTRKRAIIV